MIPASLFAEAGMNSSFAESNTSAKPASTLTFAIGVM